MGEKLTHVHGSDMRWLIAAATAFSLAVALLVYWVTPDVSEGLRAHAWPAAKGQLLSIGKGIWSPGGSRTFISRQPTGSYSGGYTGVRVSYHYSLPDATGGLRPYTGWRYDAASSSKAFLALPGMEFPRPKWEGVHPGVPFTYAGIAHSLPQTDSALMVRYDPADPSRSVLRAGIASDTAFLCIFLIAFLILALRLWLAALVPALSGTFKGLCETGIGGRTLLFASLGFLYIPASYLSAVFLQKVIPPGAVLGYIGLGLAWILAPIPFERLLNIGGLQAALNVIGRVIVASTIVFTVCAIMAGSWGWRIYKGDLVPDYAPSEETILRVLGEDDPYLYPWALYRLIDNYLTPRHLPYLREMLARKREGLTEAALHGLKTLGEEARPAVADIIEAISWHEEAVYALAAIDPRPSRALPVLIGLLDSPVWHVRTKAMELIGNLGPEAHEAAPRLRSALGDPEFRVRMGAVSALGKIKDGDAIALIVNMLQNPEPSVRQRAAEALKRYGPPAQEALPKLRMLLHDEDQWVRKEAKEAIRWIER